MGGSHIPVKSDEYITILSNYAIDLPKHFHKKNHRLQEKYFKSCIPVEAFHSFLGLIFAYSKTIWKNAGMEICSLKRQSCSLQERRNRLSHLEVMTVQRMIENEALRQTSIFSTFVIVHGTHCTARDITFQQIELESSCSQVLKLYKTCYKEARF